ncbi:MAG: hypothetical protein SFW66_03725 [Gammaproteobacteria bacterium]|nr:hypothetical protein [Gammaproteobacteria bacterium]
MRKKLSTLFFIMLMISGHTFAAPNDLMQCTVEAKTLDTPSWDRHQFIQLNIHFSGFPTDSSGKINMFGRLFTKEPITSQSFWTDQPNLEFIVNDNASTFSGNVDAKTGSGSIIIGAQLNGDSLHVGDNPLQVLILNGFVQCTPA